MVFEKVKDPGLVEKQRRNRRGWNLGIRVGPRHSLRTSGSCAQLSATSRRTEPLSRSTGSRVQRIVAATAVQLNCSWMRRPSYSLRALQPVIRLIVARGDPQVACPGRSHARPQARTVAWLVVAGLTRCAVVVSFLGQWYHHLLGQSDVVLLCWHLICSEDMSFVLIILCGWLWTTQLRWARCCSLRWAGRICCGYFRAEGTHEAITYFMKLRRKGELTTLDADAPIPNCFTSHFSCFTRDYPCFC